MGIIELLRNEFSIFQKYSLSKKLFNVVLFIWIASIPAKNSFYQISVILVPIFVAWHIFVERKFVELKTFFYRFRDLCGCLLLIILSMIISNYFGKTTYDVRWLSIIKFFERYILVLFSLLFLYERRFFTKTTLVALAIACFSFYGFHGIGQSIASHGTSDALSFLYNRNPYALVMMTGIMATTLSLIYLYERKTTSESIGILLFLLAIFIIALIYSRSRSGWISTSIFFVFLGIINRNLLKQNRILISFFTLCILPFFLLNSHLLQRLQILFNDPIREKIWTNAITLIREKLAFGYGLVEYQTIGIANIHGTHNSILEILLYTGVFGLITFSLTTCLIVRETIAAKLYNLLSALLSFAVISQFNLSIFGNKTFLSILTILLFFIFSNRIILQTSNSLNFNSTNVIK